MIGIYQLRNTENDKRYIGQSERLKHRKNQHFYDLSHNLHRSKELQKDYNKSPDSIVFEVITECSKNELDDLEKYYIKKFKANVKMHGYNSESGGTSGKGRASEETRKKLSISKLNNTFMCGIRLTDEWKRHLSEAQPHKKKLICIETGVVYDSFADAARKTGLNRTKIVSCCTGKRKTTGGYHFEYYDKGTGDNFTEG